MNLDPNASAVLGVSNGVDGAAANTVLTKTGLGTLRLQGTDGAFGSNVSNVILHVCGDGRSRSAAKPRNKDARRTGGPTTLRGGH
jgi:hypothetical protein